jgi:hypothetical protein
VSVVLRILAGFLVADGDQRHMFKKCVLLVTGDQIPLGHRLPREAANAEAS